MFADLKSRLEATYPYSQFVKVRKFSRSAVEGVAFFSKFPISEATSFLVDNRVWAGQVIVDHPQTKLQLLNVRTDLEPAQKLD
jgi:hypothetical protein